MVIKYHNRQTQLSSNSTGNTISNLMVQDMHATVVMGLHVPPQVCINMLRLTHHVSSNRCNKCSLASQPRLGSASMEAMQMMPTPIHLPLRAIYVKINNAYADWYFHQNPKHIDYSLVLGL